VAVALRVAVGFCVALLLAGVGGAVVAPARVAVPVAPSGVTAVVGLGAAARVPPTAVAVLGGVGGTVGVSGPPPHAARKLVRGRVRSHGQRRKQQDGTRFGIGFSPIVQFQRMV
jgi:hypothetical protein